MGQYFYCENAFNEEREKKNKKKRKGQRKKLLTFQMLIRNIK